LPAASFLLMLLIPHKNTGRIAGIAMEVMTAARPIAAPETAPWSSPSLAASAVPIPWAIVPIARPLAKSSLILSMFISHGPSIAPHIPVIMTKAATKTESAPMILDTSEATGIVIDLTVKDMIILFDRFIIFASMTADIIVETVPVKTPEIAGMRLAEITFLCLYSGTAKATVAGPKKYVIISLAEA
jgi:hypothetical protein